MVKKPSPSGLTPADEAIIKIENVLKDSPLSNEQKMQAILQANAKLERDEIFRRSPALAIADTILGGHLFKNPEEEPSLADEFIAATHTLSHRYTGWQRKLADDILLRYRLDMRRAHRFVLDDEFVEMATQMSATDPKKILARLQYASLPYEQTWIEFDLHTKVRAMHTLYKLNKPVEVDKIAPRLGCLLQRINDTDAVCTLVSGTENTVMPHLVCYFFSLREYDFLLNQTQAFGCHALSITHVPGMDKPVYHPTIERAKVTVDNAGKASLWGFTRGHPQGNYSDMTTPSFLLRHGDAGLSRMFNFFERVDGIQDTINNVLWTETREFTGMIRWLVTVLAMLNQVPVYAKEVVRSHQMRIDHTKKHKFVDYHKVTLRLPKLHPVPYVERHLRGPSDRRHRAHEVRAFWRTYLHEQHCDADEHDWTYDYDDGYRLCGKCMAYGRLIREHVRGNRELGWVRKDYVLKPSVKP